MTFEYFDPKSEKIYTSRIDLFRDNMGRFLAWDEWDMLDVPEYYNVLIDRILKTLTCISNSAIGVALFKILFEPHVFKFIKQSLHLNIGLAAPTELSPQRISFHLAGVCLAAFGQLLFLLLGGAKTKTGFILASALCAALFLGCIFFTGLNAMQIVFNIYLL